MQNQKAFKKIRVLQISAYRSSPSDECPGETEFVNKKQYRRLLFSSLSICLKETWVLQLLHNQVQLIHGLGNDLPTNTWHLTLECRKFLTLYWTRHHGRAESRTRNDVTVAYKNLADANKEMNTTTCIDSTHSPTIQQSDWTIYLQKCVLCEFAYVTDFNVHLLQIHRTSEPN
jgi:hypothetical protein